MKSTILLSILLASAVIITGCKSKQPLEKPHYDQPLLPGQDALRKITDPTQIPDFTIACFNLTDLRASIDRSLNYLGKASSKQYFPLNGISHSHCVRSLEEFAKLLDSGLIGAQLNEEIRRRFDVYISVGCDNEGTVLFTGYYTPVFDGSAQPSDRYSYPLYTQPPDLVKGSNGEILGKQLPDGALAPYPPRAELAKSPDLAGKELVWLTDPFEAYIAHVQGSAKIRLPDGSLETVGYAANNGREYKSIGPEMVRAGAIPKDKLSLSAMIAYFKQHRDLVDLYTNANPRFVFFRKEEGEPRGSLNEPVTQMRSIATDKSIFPRAALAFISTKLPRETAAGVTQRYYSGFALDQDTGGAIRAPGRCDVYMGVGDTAGKLAGATYQEGKLYYLFLKNTGVADYYNP